MFIKINGLYSETNLILSISIETILRLKNPRHQSLLPLLKVDFLTYFIQDYAQVVEYQS